MIEVVSADGSGPVTPELRLAEAGVDSLAFAELAALVERELGVDLSPADVDPGDRVADVLSAVDAARPRTSTSALPHGIGRLQGTAEVLGGWALRWWFHLRVSGADRVPVAGPAILAMNHESALDIPIAVLASPRRVTFMAKRELFTNAVVSWGLRRLGGFRVDRSRFDLPAVDAALEVLARGGVLGMYPEGTRSPAELRPFLHGAAWLALRTGAPLVPCSIEGTERARQATRPGAVRVSVRLHEPIPVEREDDPARRGRLAPELTARLRATIAAGLPRGALDPSA